jgi:serpin B
MHPAPHPAPTLRRRLVALVVVAGLAGACGAPAGDEVRGDAPRRQAPERAGRPVAAAVNAFGIDLYRALAPRGGNFVIAPQAVASSLAMARAGAGSTTREQLDRVLHLDGVVDPEQGFNALGAALDARRGERRSEVRVGEVAVRASTALWAQEDTRFDPSFLDVLSAEFGSGVRVVDFRSDPERARRTVNAWLEGDSGGQLTDLVPRGTFTQYTRFVVTSAFTLRAPWLVPFPDDGVRPRPFTLADGRTVEVPTLATRAETGLRHGRGDGWEAVELPYLGEELAMVVILPDDPASFDATLDRERLEEVVRSLRPGPLEVALPAFGFTTRLELSDVLASLGMPAAFDPAVADFAGITTDEQLVISDVPTETYASVGPDGSEGEATTVVTTGPSRRFAAPSVRIDRPFLFVVVDRPTGVVLQCGRVVDPRS